MLTTYHQYVTKYPINHESEKLIVGTIHPHFHEKFRIPFYYGNVASLWNLLSDAFPEEFRKPVNLKNILNFLDKKKISMSDTILKCHRKNASSFDNDLIPIELNYRLIEDIKVTNINHILFTSGFQKNSAFRLFYEEILGLKVSSEIKQKKEIILDKMVFGREIRLTILLSPSGSSNIGLSKSQMYLDQKHRFLKSNRPVYDFKVEYYRGMFR